MGPPKTKVDLRCGISCFVAQHHIKLRSARKQVLTLMNLLNPTCDPDSVLSGGQDGQRTPEAAIATRQGVEALARLLTRLDNMSHILVWSANRALTRASTSNGAKVSVDLIELPRLRLNFRRRCE